MATGIVLDFTSDLHTAGHVKIDETDEILTYFDNNFPNTGLKLNDKCTFDVVLDRTGALVATNLQPLAVPAPVPIIITAPFNGNLTANVGAIITVTGAAAVVTGNIIINGGKVIIDENARVNGLAHTINDGTLVARNRGKIIGPISVDNGGNLKIVGKGKIVGPISINSGGRMIVGNDTGPGYITGSIDVLKIRRFTLTADSKVNEDSIA